MAIHQQVSYSDTVEDMEVGAYSWQVQGGGGWGFDRSLLALHLIWAKLGSSEPFASQSHRHGTCDAADHLLREQFRACTGTLKSISAVAPWFIAALPTLNCLLTVGRVVGSINDLLKMLKWSQKRKMRFKQTWGKSTEIIYDSPWKALICTVLGCSDFCSHIPEIIGVGEARLAGKWGWHFYSEIK